MAFRYDTYNYSRNTRIKIGIAMAFVIAIFLALPAALLLKSTSLDEYVNVWGPTECLINYQGGFVRRGLLGQLFFLIGKFTHTSPLIYVYIFCFACYLAIVWIMACDFQKKKWAWWIIFAYPLCGYINNIVRKDFMMYLLIILIINCAVRLRSDAPAPHSHSSHNIWYSLLLFISMGVAMLNHEGFLFFGLTAAFLYLLHVDRRSTLAFGMLAAAFCLFFIASIFKGDPLTVSLIYDSLDSLHSLPATPKHGAIDALQWNVKDTLRMHFDIIFNAPYRLWPSDSIPARIIGTIILFFKFLIPYYLMTNLPAVFTFNRSESDRLADRDNLGSLLSVTFITMLPMILFLCCDRSRVLQFWTMGAFLPAMLIPGSDVAEMMPRHIKRFSHGLNSFLARLLSPRPWILILLYFILLSSPLITIYRKLTGIIPM